MTDDHPGELACTANSSDLPVALYIQTLPVALYPDLPVALYIQTLLTHALVIFHQHPPEIRHANGHLKDAFPRSQAHPEREPRSKLLFTNFSETRDWTPVSGSSHERRASLYYSIALCVFSSLDLRPETRERNSKSRVFPRLPQKVRSNT